MTECVTTLCFDRTSSKRARLEGYIDAGDLGELCFFLDLMYLFWLLVIFFPLLCLFECPPSFTPPFFPDFAHTYLHSLNNNFFSVPLVLTTEEIQAIDDARAKGPPRSCMLNFSGWTACTLVNRAASLALLAGAAVLGMRLYFGVGG